MKVRYKNMAVVTFVKAKHVLTDMLTCQLRHATALCTGEAGSGRAGGEPSC